MVQLLLVVIAILLSFAFFTLDEETLIILCSFLWLDAAGGLFKQLLDGELVHKVAAIRSKFLWYLSVKRSFLQDLLRVHGGRVSLAKVLTSLNNTIVLSLLTSTICLFLDSFTLEKRYASHLWVVNFGGVVYHLTLLNKLEASLSLFPFSSTLLIKTSNFDAASSVAYSLLFSKAV